MNRHKLAENGRRDPATLGSGASIAWSNSRRRKHLRRDPPPEQWHRHQTCGRLLQHVFSGASSERVSKIQGS